MGKVFSPPALGDFCNFLIKITYFLYTFRQNSYFKAVTHQLKAFEKQSKRINRIHEAQVLNIRINVTNYEITFATKGVLTPSGYTPLGPTLF